jgi:hypothetical protein
MENLDLKSFNEKIYDLSEGSNMKYRGLVPSVLLFYSPGAYMDKMVSAINSLEPLYTGKAHFYGIDVNVSGELTDTIGVRAIPTMILIPVQRDPAILTGLVDTAEKLETIFMKMNLI